jgi:hypothetical protein
MDPLMLRKLDSIALTLLAVGAVVLGGLAIVANGSSGDGSPDRTLGWAIPLTALGGLMFVVSAASLATSPYRERLLTAAILLGIGYFAFGLILFGTGTT